VARTLLVLGFVKQVVGAAAGGIAATVADVAVLAALVQLARCPIPIAAFLASAVGAAVGFIVNKYFAFRDHSPITFSQVARFAMVAGATAVLMALLMKWVAVDLHVPYLYAKVLCALAVFVAWTYPAQRRLVFAR
jgi:putative flippase GtrA